MRNFINRNLVPLYVLLWSPLIVPLIICTTPKKIETKPVEPTHSRLESRNMIHLLIVKETKPDGTEQFKYRLVAPRGVLEVGNEILAWRV